ncbi:DUF1353 domain-containing protein [Hymenobacter latericus]|uniref:DUF1353 domain-containing protein n=1 Tax=Hymenobacter sp. YIM 151858-1 TaxID=2987688 RepID=UPI002227CD39|nr:DUF1353 domain-containing protein [Hymenobacter sp. YIM 151858-1]UYZ60194.1 DUF1353 domain-containing protein [Hymenobacter sp. YIM 151858-1]
MKKLGLLIIALVFISAIRVNPPRKGSFNLPTAPLVKAPKDFVSNQLYTYTDTTGKVWTAPVQTITDGASIPKPALAIIGDRYDDPYVGAALVHDAYCSSENNKGASFHKASWRQVHRMFYDACVAGGTNPVKAKIMYAAVWLFGPRWEFPTPGRSPASTGSISKARMEINELDISSAPATQQKAQLNEIIDYINDKDPELDVLDGVMEASAYSLKSNRVLTLPGAGTK